MAAPGIPAGMVAEAGMAAAGTGVIPVVAGMVAGITIRARATHGDREALPPPECSITLVTGIPATVAAAQLREGYLTVAAVLLHRVITTQARPGECLTALLPNGRPLSQLTEQLPEGHSKELRQNARFHNRVMTAAASVEVRQYAANLFTERQNAACLSAVHQQGLTQARAARLPTAAVTAHQHEHSVPEAADKYIWNDQLRTVIPVRD